MAERFMWDGVLLAYERGEYNNARDNERAVEVPIARSWIERRAGIGFEVGNVLSHYGDVSWPVVDRYEGPIRTDVLDLHADAGPVDWIVSVSTLEHVRWDEEPREPDGTERAIYHLRSLLTDDGRMLVTIPFGWRDDLDETISSGALGEYRAWVFRRVKGSRRRWVEADLTFRSAWGPSGGNAVWIAEFLALRTEAV